MVRYPYLLWVKTLGTPSKDAQGNFVPGVSSWEAVGPCRDDVAKPGQLITLEDGSAYSVTTTVYVPKDTASIATGAEVEIRETTGSVRVRGVCQQFGRYQLSACLYL